MMDVKGKKVLVVGLGKSGVAAALFLRRMGAVVTVSDARSAESLSREIPKLIEAGVMVETGGHGVMTFRQQDLIVVSPGVPFHAPALEQARAIGRPVIGEIELAAHYLRGKMLAVTGSNGKTTTTTLLGEILKEAGLATQVGGNIGVPVIDLIPASTEESWAVLEVSSFQLESTVEFRPAVAVILNITPDHLDRHGSFENYALAKERIFMAQQAGDCTVLNADDARTAASAERVPSQVYWFSRQHKVERGAWVEEGEIVYRGSKDGAVERILPVSRISLKGAHNVENVLAAVVAARLAGAAGDAVARAVEKFKAVEHRLEYVTTIEGVEYYNDSKATNVDATEKAIEAFAGGIHLILGGKDKGSDYTTLSPLLQERVKAVYTIGAAAAKIEKHLKGVLPLYSCGTLDKAVEAAAEAAKAGEIVLLAPACSSFDQFKCFEQRGEIFKQLVMARKGK